MRNKLGNIIWGLIFIIIGVGYAGAAMKLWDFTIFFPGWWTLFIIIPCLVSIIQSGVNIGSITGLIIGIMLLAAHYIRFDINFWKLIIPTILIALGLKIILQGVRRKPIDAGPGVYIEGQENYSSAGRKSYTAVFSSNNIKVTDRFTGADLNAVFGGISLDLRDAVIDGNVEITATAVFGGIDIYIPNGVQVKVNNIPIFGGVGNRHRYESSNGYIIYLNSTTMFGGIDIK